MTASEHAPARLARFGDAVKGMTLGLALLLGAFVRLQPALSADFPLVDGGLFFSMIRDLQASNYRLPEFTSYNNLSIPFLYPPLSFHVLGRVADVTGADLLDLLRIVPALLSVLSLPAFLLLARRILPSATSVAAAMAAYAFLPTAFDFLIVGGGLPRAFAILPSILALAAFQRAAERPDRRMVLATGLLAGLTVLSHPVVAWFTLYSGFALAWFHPSRRRATWTLAQVWGIALVVSMPWWAAGLANHGLGPFLAAFGAGARPWSWLAAPFLFMQSNEPYLHLLGVLALIGLFAEFRRRRYLTPAWLGLVFVLEPRLSATYAAIPTALLAGVGIELVGRALLGQALGEGMESRQVEADPARAARAGPGGKRLLAIAAVYGGLYLLLAAFLSAPRAELSRAEIKVMDWIRRSTPPDSRFVVVSGIGAAGVDSVSEWFPALTGRTSVATPQGLEWLPDRAYDVTLAQHAELQACAAMDAACLQNWAALTRTSFTHVLVTRPSSRPGEEFAWARLVSSLRGSMEFTVIYEDEDAAVFSALPAASSP